MIAQRHNIKPAELKGRLLHELESLDKALGLEALIQSRQLELEEQELIEYFNCFHVPEDYQHRILEAHRKLTAAYDDIKGQREALKASLTRLKDQYRWGHISRQEYLKEYQETEAQLRPLRTIENKEDELKRLAHFLANVADAWREANQLQRNKLAKVLFEEIRFDSGGKVIAVKPRNELEPFFRLSYECHVKDIGCDPEGI